jgi:DNA-binding beta-propeller fold protein YncE
MRRRRFFAPALVAVLPLVAARAHAAQSFIYVAPSCQDTAGCATSVLVYDANTGGLAASIPLPADMNPFGLKLSQDGQRLYVALSRGGGTSVTVIDTTRHVVVGTHDAGNAIGGMAVSRDGSRLFFASGTTLFIYDTAANAIVATAAAGGLLQSIAASPSSDRIYTVEGIGVEAVRQYDSLSGAPIPGGANTNNLFWSHIHVSRDGSRVFVTAPASGNHPSSGGFVTIFDPSNWATVLTAPVRLFPAGSVEAATRRLLFSWERGHVSVNDSGTLSHLGDINLSAQPINMVVNADESRAWMASAASTDPPSINALYAIDVQSNAVLSTVPLAGSSSVVASPPNAAVCNYQVDTKLSPWTVSGGSAPIALRTPCAWATTSDAPWAHLNSTSGTGDAMLALTVDPNSTGSTRTATLSIGGRLVTVTQAGRFSQAGRSRGRRYRGRSSTSGGR